MGITLAKDLYSTMVANAFFAQQNGGPDALVKTMREISLESLIKWQEDEKSMAIFAKKYLTDSITEWKAWELDMQTAARLWKLHDLCEFIVMEL